jgi:hypothetical protein
MRVLLTNHHLQYRAGSELYCLELATTLQRGGHEVAVFTFAPGSISEELTRRGVPVFSTGDAARIEAFDPEILHVHHSPCLYFLGALRLRAAVVFSSLGVVPALEAAPIRWEGVAQGLGVSEEVVEVLRQTRFGEAVPLSVFRNWFDDGGLSPLPPEKPGEARRIAVVTNHLDATLARDLDALRASHPGLSWTHLGMPTNSVKITPELLRSFDRVITLGRTALLAAALQRPCLVYDVHGCDGLLTAERLDSLAARNFSGRLTRARPSREELEHLLLDEAMQVDVARLAERVWREYSLSRRVEELQGLYARVLQGGVRLNEQARPCYGREGQIYAEAMQGQQLFHARLVLHEQALREEQARREEHERLLAEVGHQRSEQGARAQALEAELEAKNGEAANLRAALESERSFSRRLRAELESIHTSMAWKGVNLLRSLKDRAFFPPRTRRRQIYDHALQRFKREERD